MKTCKDCIHYNVCDYFVKIRTETLSSISSSEDCLFFQDKSKFIEPPCSVGDFCIYKDAEWYINVIEWDGEEFVLWISPAHKQACSVEVLANEVRVMTAEEVNKMFERINTERKKLYEKERTENDFKSIS